MDKDLEEYVIKEGKPAVMTLQAFLEILEYQQDKFDAIAWVGYINTFKEVINDKLEGFIKEKLDG